MLTILGVIVLLIIIGSTIGGIAGSKKVTTAPGAVATNGTGAPAPRATDTVAGTGNAVGDVKITKCANGDLGGPSADLVVTNHSSKASNYIVTIAFESKDGKTQYGTGDAAIDDLQAGQASAPQTADSLTTTPGPNGFVCRVSDVTRYAS